MQADPGCGLADAERDGGLADRELTDGDELHDGALAGGQPSQRGEGAAARALGIELVPGSGAVVGLQ